MGQAREQGQLVVVFGETNTIGLEELEQASGLARGVIEELAGAGCLGTVQRVGTNWLFDAACVAEARRARRLQLDLELDDAGLAVAVMLLARVSALEKRLRELEYWVLGNP